MNPIDVPAFKILKSYASFHKTSALISVLQWPSWSVCVCVCVWEIKREREILTCFDDPVKILGILNFFVICSYCPKIMLLLRLRNIHIYKCSGSGPLLLGPQWNYVEFNNWIDYINMIVFKMLFSSAQFYYSIMCTDWNWSHLRAFLYITNTDCRNMKMWFPGILISIVYNHEGP